MISVNGLPGAAWRKSSYSSDNGGNCLEIADGDPNAVPVRDSKAPQGPALVFGAHHWTAFVSALRSGTLSA